MHVYNTIFPGLNQPTAVEVNLLQCLLQCSNLLQTYYGGYKNPTRFKMKLFATIANG